MRGLFAVPFALLLAGCGYVGDPMPPALNIPVAVTDLEAVQRGSELHIDFTIPALTTEQLGIRRLGGVDLRIGPAGAPFDIGQWSGTARALPVSKDTPGRVHVVVPAADWKGQDAIVAVRLANTRGRYSGWSNVKSVHVVAPLTTPQQLAVKSHAEGVQVLWQEPGAPPGVEYRVYRSSPEQKDPALLDTVGRTEYIDRTAVYGKSYSYSVQAVSGTAESERTAEAAIVPKDTFPPAVPSGLTAIAGLNSIELAWERNTEADLQGYRVYRSEGGGPFNVVGALVEAPSYSDKTVAGGKTYRYAVSSVDQSGNESERSKAVEIAAP